MSTSAEAINSLARQEQRMQVARPLYEIEEDLLALLETEGMVPEEQEHEYRAELAEQLRKAVSKRDRVAQFVRHCELMAESSKAEETRLRDRRKLYESAADKLREYVKHVLEAMGPERTMPNGQIKWKKLEGSTVTFGLRNNPGSVKITDETLIPDQYKRITVKLPLDLWNLLINIQPQAIADRLQAWLAAHPTEVETLKTPIKEALERGAWVDGADLESTTSLTLR